MAKKEQLKESLWEREQFLLASAKWKSDFSFRQIKLQYPTLCKMSEFHFS